MPKRETSTSKAMQRVLAELGVEISGDFPNEVGEVVVNHALYSTTQHSKITRDSSLSGKRCVAGSSLDICGNGKTDDNGEMSIRLEDFICLNGPGAAGDSFERILPPLYFVATPMINTPVMITYKIISRPDEPDSLGFNIKVFTWGISGDPKPKVRFQWRCCVQFAAEVIG